MQPKSVYNKNIWINEQKFYYLTLQKGSKNKKDLYNYIMGGKQPCKHL